MRAARILCAAAALCAAVSSYATAEDPAGKPDAGGVYYEPPQNLCDELGGSPECPPDGGPVDPAKRGNPESAPETIYQAPAETSAPPRAAGDGKPEAYKELESDCEKAGWGGAPTCD